MGVETDKTVPTNKTSVGDTNVLCYHFLTNKDRYGRPDGRNLRNLQYWNFQGSKILCFPCRDYKNPLLGLQIQKQLLMTKQDINTKLQLPIIGGVVLGTLLHPPLGLRDHLHRLGDAIYNKESMSPHQILTAPTPWGPKSKMAAIGLRWST